MGNVKLSEQRLKTIVFLGKQSGSSHIASSWNTINLYTDA